MPVRAPWPAPPVMCGRGYAAVPPAQGALAKHHGGVQLPATARPISKQITLRGGRRLGQVPVRGLTKLLKRAAFSRIAAS